MDVATTNAVDVAQHEKRSETYHFFTQAGFSALGQQSLTEISGKDRCASLKEGFG